MKDVPDFLKDVPDFLLTSVLVVDLDPMMNFFPEHALQNLIQLLFDFLGQRAFARSIKGGSTCLGAPVC